MYNQGPLLSGEFYGCPSFGEVVPLSGKSAHRPNVFIYICNSTSDLYIHDVIHLTAINDEIDVINFNVKFTCGLHRTIHM